MMLTLPTLVAALVLPASAQIFRLPDADACEKSKTSIYSPYIFEHPVLTLMFVET